MFSRMLFILLLCCLFATTFSQSCPQGSIQLPQANACAVVKQTGVQNGYFQADSVCQDLGGRLISLHNAFSNSMLVAYATGVNNAMTNLYIGGDNHRNNEYSWIDRSSMNYTNWSSGEPRYTSGDCMAVRLSDGKWFVTKCDQSIPFICEVPAVNTQSSVAPATTPPITACPGNWTRYSGNCYNVVIFDTGLNWKSARIGCQNNGAELVSIHSAEENAFILGLCGSLPVTADADYWPWIGLTYNHGEFQWTDGTNGTYMNLADAKPRYKKNVYDIATSGTNKGKWDYYDGTEDLASNAYICKKPMYSA